MKMIKILSLAFSSIIMSTMMTTMNTPMIMWILMEMSNILFIMMFMLMHYNNINTSTTMMMIQFFSSSSILMSILTNNNTMMSLGILMKLGMTPAHNWLPMVILMSPWKLNMLTLTLPKIPPFLLMDLLSNLTLIYTSITITALISTIKLMKTMNNKIIMALSSMIHSSWMCLTKSISSKGWLLYLSLYSINTIMICMIIPKISSPNMNKPTKTILSMMMFSMISTPPLTTFTGKLFLLSMSKFTMLIPLTALIMSSAMAIIYYSKIFMKIIFLYKKTNKMKMKTQTPKMMWILTMLLIMLII